MKNLKLSALLSALGVAVYVAAVAWLMTNAEKIFGKMQNFLGPVAFLMLFVLSAAVVGALIVGRPALLYFDNRKAEAVKMFGWTIGWLLLLILVVFGIQFAI